MPFSSMFLKFGLDIKLVRIIKYNYSKKKWF